jgi:hypothetical protein
LTWLVLSKNARALITGVTKHVRCAPGGATLNFAFRIFRLPCLRNAAAAASVLQGFRLVNYGLQIWLTASAATAAESNGCCIDRKHGWAQ